MSIEILHVRPDDGACEVRVWVNGHEVEASSLTLVDVDTGVGYSRQQWNDLRRRAVTNPDHSLSFCEAANVAFKDHEGSGYIS